MSARRTRIPPPAHPARGRPAATSGRRGAGAATLEAVLALEALDPAGRVHQLLLAGEERMARRADLDVDRRHGGAGLDDVAAGTDDGRLLVPRMDAFLHGRRPPYHRGRGGATRGCRRAWRAARRRGRLSEPVSSSSVRARLLRRLVRGGRAARRPVYCETPLTAK